ncbi:MAG TPA: SCO family protein [Kofleriaceae bacterium]|nr:SCO family protein [Kofleriaceae bacterium]
MKISSHRTARIAALGGAMAALCSAGPMASADPVAPGSRADEPAPDEMKGVELVEHLGARLPLDLDFIDETGAPIRLGSLFGDDKPVILTFNYSNCPMLCSVQLGGLVETMTKLKWSAGKEFRVITIGLDPTEGHRRAMETKMSYLGRYRRPTADEGWRFLTGTEATVKALADAVGFGYHRNPATGDYLHPAVITLVSPKGVVASYMYGIAYEPGALTLLLGAAQHGTLTESARKFLLACFHYETKKGAAATAQRVMQLGGLLFVGGLLAVFGTRAARARARRARERTPERT